MGCGTSTQQAPPHHKPALPESDQAPPHYKPALPESNQVQRLECRPSDELDTPTGGQHCTWATKTDVSGNGFGAASASFAPAPQHQGPFVLLDADDDEIQIIDEGPLMRQAKTTQAVATARAEAGGKQDKVRKSHTISFAANVQEAPASEYAEPPSKSAAMQLDLEPPTRKSAASQLVLSTRQQEEAARLAQQRKRFDNQRYQRSSWPSVSPDTFTGLYPVVAQSEKNRKPEDTPRHELVLGLNVTETIEDGREQLTFDDCIPGGIHSSTPTLFEVMLQAEAADKNRSKHDIFDDDDELLMMEIVNSTD